MICIQPAYVQIIKPSSSEGSTEASKSADEVMDANRSLAMMRECQLAWQQLRTLRWYVYSSDCINISVNFNSSFTVHEEAIFK